MTEQELRALVRDAIARHTAAMPPGARSAGLQPDLSRHASHAMFVLATGADDGGPCVIEPAVACTHCGYCKSYGH
ncbi:MAG TPA: hypothetical protein VFV95_13695 [Vicinamibacterales bacterium]|nr:hypothetical protein [Vicinamibacterales bacterium]